MNTVINPVINPATEASADTDRVFRVYVEKRPA